MDWIVLITIVQCLAIDPVMTLPTQAYAGDECLMSYEGLEYQGRTSVTVDGLTCQAWAAQEPHKHDDSNFHFPDATQQDAANYCRNPDGHDEGPWCYTTDPDVDWGHCDIPLCSKPTADPLVNSSEPQECLVSPQGLEYVGHQSVTHNNRTCQAWRAQVPHTHVFYNSNHFPDSTMRDAANYCRNPDADVHVADPWCYTTDPQVRWEYCNISLCSTGSSNNFTGDECLMSYQGLEYQGRTSVTVDGLTCQAWAAQEPHKHDDSNFHFPDATRQDAANYCRNPDGHDRGPWCYTTDPDVQWGYCDIPLCTKPTAHPPANSSQLQGKGFIVGLAVGMLLVGMLLGIVIMVIVMKAHGRFAANMKATVMTFSNPGYENLQNSE